MGTASLRSLQYTATGQSFVLGQPPTAAEPWPLRPIKSYQVFVDYGSNSMRLEQVITDANPAAARWWRAVRRRTASGAVRPRRVRLE